jgi:hypothetical protein
MVRDVIAFFLEIIQQFPLENSLEKKADNRHRPATPSLAGLLAILASRICRF